MKSSMLPVIVLFLLNNTSTAQHNCSNPLPVTLCPATVLTAQTNLGMLDDFTNPCNLSGEDLVYSMTTGPNTTKVYISFSSISGNFRAYFYNTCNPSICGYNLINAPSNLTYTVTGNTTYFLWIDALTTVTYDVAFGNDTASTFVSIPNTQGNLAYDASGCATPMFKSSKPFFQVSYNGVYKTDPMTMSPLNVPGTLCIVAYFKNTTGIEAINKFSFYYNPAGFSSFTPVSSTLPGFYLPGSWVATSGTNKWAYTFYDTLGIGKGDFSLIPNTCLRYEFCFNVTPVTNDPVLTNILDSAWSDGFGAGFSGTIRSGCCPPGFANCLGNSGSGPSSSAHAFGFGMNDPGSGGLPIVLLSFDAHENNGDVEINWITRSEINNEYFTIQKSRNAVEWIPEAIISGAGNSTTELFYSYTDRKAFEGVSYYRLKQTDYDGTCSYSNVVAVTTTKTEIQLYPNPVDDLLWVETGTGKNADLNFYIVSNIGRKWKPKIRQGSQPGVYGLDLSSIEPGTYVLQIDGITDSGIRKIILKN